MDEYMSKKDLLKQTGISYGQLYRWKREKIIPEDWFIKQSSPTGQETYFPKEKVLTRVHRILAWKDAYSLEEMASLLSPEFINRIFSEEELDSFEEIDVAIAAIFMDSLQKDEFSFRELVWMMAFTNVCVGLADEVRDALITHMMQQMTKVETLDYVLAVVQIQEDVVGMIYESDHIPILDERMQILKSVSLQELSQMMKEKYEHTLHFIKE